MSKPQTWNKEFQNISIQYQKGSVQLLCDSTLKKYLLQKGNGSLALAEHILSSYESTYHCPLQIGQHSLALEILGHAYTDTLTKAVLSAKAFIPAAIYSQLEPELKKLKEQTEIIDCKEKSENNNRFLWDTLDKYHTIIYKLLGDLA